MSSAYLTLPEIVNELRSLTVAKATGTFFIVSDEKHSAMIGFERGQLVGLQCRLRSGEKAIPLIACIKRGSCRFDNGQNYIRKMDLVDDNEDIFQSILSAQEQSKGGDSGSVLPSAPKRELSSAAKQTKGLSITPDQRLEISQLLSEELGPMGNMVLNSIENCTDLHGVESVINENASGLGIEDMLVRKIETILKL
ncbi:MAG: hypothetical protein ABW157_07955 [Candidatus Thiodiazotropha sp. LLP2]